ncbi:MAG: hypothetical protein IBX43_09915 [Campylobacterales bacterium]|nr:hypothetical protein [Campylobacterales bacterium]
MRLRKWIGFYIAIPIILITLIFSFNFIIDPYSMTAYNLLNIPNKFARDDRKEKVAKLYTEDSYTNMLFGSSHVYSINPLVAQKYLGGERSYNAGVGTARIEDHLGFLLYLKRINKLPKNIIVGLDFYSFNQNVETNKYFLVNDDLNFLHQTADSGLYFSKFLSLDALRASYKTLRNFLKESKEKPRFDTYGTAGNASEIFIYYPEKKEQTSFDEEMLIKGCNDVKTIKYETISQDRLQYIQDIMFLCKENNIQYTFFITPLSGQLLSKINSDSLLSSTLQRFKSELSEITSYYDFLTHNQINDNRFYFGGDTMHTTTFTGNLILARIFDDKSITLPDNFGLFVPKKEVRP